MGTSRSKALRATGQFYCGRPVHFLPGNQELSSTAETQRTPRKIHFWRFSANSASRRWPCVFPRLNLVLLCNLGAGASVLPVEIHGAGTAFLVESDGEVLHRRRSL